jgi:hypothetical protein
LGAIFESQNNIVHPIHGHGRGFQTESGIDARLHPPLRQNRTVPVHRIFFNVCIESPERFDSQITASQKKGIGSELGIMANSWFTKRMVLFPGSEKGIFWTPPQISTSFRVKLRETFDSKRGHFQ